MALIVQHGGIFLVVGHEQGKYAVFYAVACRVSRPYRSQDPLNALTGRHQIKLKQLRPILQVRKELCKASDLEFARVIQAGSKKGDDYKVRCIATFPEVMVHYQAPGINPRTVGQEQLDAGNQYAVGRQGVLQNIDVDASLGGRIADERHAQTRLRLQSIGTLPVGYKPSEIQ